MSLIGVPGLHAAHQRHAGHNRRSDDPNEVAGGGPRLGGRVRRETGRSRAGAGRHPQGAGGEQGTVDGPSEEESTIVCLGCDPLLPVLPDLRCLCDVGGGVV